MFEGEKRVVLAEADVCSGAHPGAALAHENVSG